MSATPGGPARLGFIGLQPGVSRLNGLTLLYIGLTGIPFMAFINFIQPIILEVILGLPRADRGPLTANLAVAQEIILMLLVGPFGALCDRIGRRPIIVMGYLIIGAGFMAYPWATSPTMLVLIRAGYAVGAAAIVAAYSTLLADYPVEKSRGKLIAVLGVLNGLGIGVLGFAGGNLPNWLELAGYEPVTASRLTMSVVAVVCIVSALFMVTGLRGGREGTGHARQPLGRLLAEGLGAARNPRIAVAYAAAFAARGDVVVIGTYLSLWVTQAGIEQGLSPAAAQGRAGLEFAVVSGAALLVTPLLGILNDRIDRARALFIGMAFAALGYLVFGFQQNPLAEFAIFASALLGAGQMSSILAGQTLISQEAEPRIAGSIIGVFSFFGALGTLMGGWVGGQLFGLWRPGAPFILMGCFNLLVCLAALWVSTRPPVPAGARAGDLLASAAVAPRD